MAPGEHILNDGSADLARGLDHFEHLMTKQLLQIFGHRSGAFVECAATAKNSSRWRSGDIQKYFGGIFAY
jgi:hypothetical protein